MDNSIFTPMEIDAIGEIMNISLGSSATAVSNMLDHRVDITTPRVTIEEVKDFTLGELQPAMGVEIKYVSGLEGSNIMLLKKSDIKVIVDILMDSETSDEEFELNELTISAVCEVMNQMMGAASTALSDFLGRLVNISTPQSLELDDVEAFKKSQFKDGEERVVVVRFSLSIENALESEFMNIMPIALARELVSGFGLGDEDEAPAVNPLMIPAPEPAGGTMSQADIERMMASMAGGGETPPPAPEPSGGVMSQAEIERMMASMSGGGATPPPAPEPSGGVMSQADIERMMASMPGGNAAAPSAPAAPAGAQGAYPPPSYGAGYPGYPPGYMPVPPGYPYLPPDPKVIATQAVAMPQLDPASKLSSEQAENLDLIMTVPLEVTVEIGRTRRKVQDILSFSKGSLVVLDKLAGDQVDLFVNGKCIARGDVVVIDDNFGIRITEILQKPGLEGLTQGK